ncbi:MAG: ComEA family DNA-binding protein [Dehalococcoidia bacterium]|nr:ComEA family DNA-binding protein [Dehalococcoidia bacterium]
MTGIREKMWLIIAALLAFCLITGIVFFFIRLSNLQPAEIILSDFKQADINGDVCISGSVARPGIYATRPGDTLTALISAAGISDDAYVGGISIYVPAKGETDRPQKVDINRADSWLLQALPGIGEGKATQIIDYRTANGPFRSVDDLLKIKGFGKSAVDGLRSFASTGE